MRSKRLRTGQWDLQAKIVLVLIGVIVPTFIVVTIAQNKITQPILEEEMREIGINSGKTLAAEIVSGKMLNLSPSSDAAIESRLQEVLYSQPNILRIDVIVKDPSYRRAPHGRLEHHRGGPDHSAARDRASRFGHERSEGRRERHPRLGDQRPDRDQGDQRANIRF